MSDRITIERAKGEEFSVGNSKGQLIKLTGWKATIAGWALSFLAIWLACAAVVGSVVIVLRLMRLVAP